MTIVIEQNGEVTIPEDEYESLLRDSVFLNCLRNAGVDNWDGYDYAIEEFNHTMDQEDGA